MIISALFVSQMQSKMTAASAAEAAAAAAAAAYHPLTSAQRKALEDELHQEQELLKEDQRNAFQHGVPTKKRVSLLHISLFFVGTERTQHELDVD